MVLKVIPLEGERTVEGNHMKVAALGRSCPGDLTAKGQVGSVYPFCKGMNLLVVFFAV